MQVLALGILFNTLAQAPATMIQATGHPKWMAILHIIELPLFVLALWGLTHEYGIIGTAIASAGRFTLDSLILFVIATRNLVRIELRPVALITPVLVAAVMLVVAAVDKSLLFALLTVLIGVPLFAAYAWFSLLSGTERNKFISLLPRKAHMVQSL
jgi:O-antigen/teichoic acid export membrane protein